MGLATRSCWWSFIFTLSLPVLYQCGHWTWLICCCFSPLPSTVDTGLANEEEGTGTRASLGQGLLCLLINTYEYITTEWYTATMTDIPGSDICNSWIVEFSLYVTAFKQEIVTRQFVQAGECIHMIVVYRLWLSIVSLLLPSCIGFT